MKTVLENQISEAFAGGITELESLQIRCGESPEIFWTTCLLSINVVLFQIGNKTKQWQSEHPGETKIPTSLLTHINDYGQPITWNKLTELGDEVKKRCELFLSKHANKN